MPIQFAFGPAIETPHALDRISWLPRGAGCRSVQTVDHVDLLQVYIEAAQM